MRGVIVLLLLCCCVCVNADIVVLKRIDPSTNLPEVIRGSVDKKKKVYILTKTDGSVVRVAKEEILDRFRNERQYQRYLDKNENSMDTLIKLENEVSELRGTLMSLTDDATIEIRPVKNRQFEFYQFERRLDTKSDMMEALKGNRKAMKDYERYYRAYIGLTGMGITGIALSVVSALSGIIVGSTALGIQLSGLVPETQREVSSTALIVAGSVSGGLFLTGLGLSIGGLSERKAVKMKFILPVEYYNRWLEREQKMESSSFGTRKIGVEFSFSF